jgi:5-methylthioadenosine/S-adenosylhomocysteine deaminase
VPTPIDLLITNATVVPMDEGRTVLTHASIAVARGQIIEIGETASVDHRYSADRTIDGSQFVAIPGLINAHNHLFQALCRGLGDGHDLSTWAARAIWPIAPLLDKAACRVAASLACIEMIESGTTTVVDSHYLHAVPDAQDGVAEGCLAAGIRTILGRAAMDTGPVPAAFLAPADACVRATELFIERWNGKSNLLFARPEAMNELTASSQLIRGLSRVARTAGVGFHMHVSEERSRPDRIERETGFRTVEYLDRLGVLGPEVVLAHCVWLNDKEKALLATTGTNVVHNPISNQFLADGVAPIPDLRQRGIRVALGTDGAASNDSLDMFGVMKSAALLHKVTAMRSDALTAPDVLEMATIVGARALGIDTVVGSLAPGKRADIVLIALDTPSMVPLHSLWSNLVYSAATRAVEVVIIEGRIVAEGGRCVSLDRQEIIRDAATLGRRLLPTTSHPLEDRLT